MNPKRHRFSKRPPISGGLTTMIARAHLKHERALITAAATGIIENLPANVNADPHFACSAPDVPLVRRELLYS